MSHVYRITPEDYNQPSAERVELLKTLKAKLEHQPVPTAFWAVCQLADIERLRALSVGESEVLEYTFAGANQLVKECESTFYLS